MAPSPSYLSSGHGSKMNTPPPTPAISSASQPTGLSAASEFFNGRDPYHRRSLSPGLHSIHIPSKLKEGNHSPRKPMSSHKRASNGSYESSTPAFSATISPEPSSMRISPSRSAGCVSLSPQDLLYSGMSIAVRSCNTGAFLAFPPQLLLPIFPSKCTSSSSPETFVTTPVKAAAQLTTIPPYRYLSSPSHLQIVLATPKIGSGGCNDASPSPILYGQPCFLIQKCDSPLSIRLSSASRVLNHAGKYPEGEIDGPTTALPEPPMILLSASVINAVSSTLSSNSATGIPSSTAKSSSVGEREHYRQDESKNVDISWYSSNQPSPAHRVHCLYYEETIDMKNTSQSAAKWIFIPYHSAASISNTCSYVERCAPSTDSTNKLASPTASFYSMPVSFKDDLLIQNCATSELLVVQLAVGTAGGTKIAPPMKAARNVHSFSSSLQLHMIACGSSVSVLSSGLYQCSWSLSPAGLSVTPSWFKSFPTRLLSPLPIDSFLTFRSDILAKEQKRRQSSSFSATTGYSETTLFGTLAKGSIGSDDPLVEQLQRMWPLMSRDMKEKILLEDLLWCLTGFDGLLVKIIERNSDDLVPLGPRDSYGEAGEWMAVPPSAFASDAPMEEIGSTSLSPRWKTMGYGQLSNGRPSQEGGEAPPTAFTKLPAEASSSSPHGTSYLYRYLPTYTVSLHPLLDPLRPSMTASPSSYLPPASLLVEALPIPLTACPYDVSSERGGNPPWEDPSIIEGPETHPLPSLYSATPSVDLAFEPTVASRTIFPFTSSSLPPMNADASLTMVVRSIAQVCTTHRVICKFVELQASPLQGLVNHAFCAALRNILAEFMVKVTQIETHQRRGLLTLQKLRVFVQPALTMFTVLQKLVCTLYEQGRCQRDPVAGGQIINSIHSLLQRLAKGDVCRQLCEFLLRQAAIPMCKMVEKWIYRGLIDDPYNEFFIKEDRTLLPSDHEMKYSERDFPVGRDEDNWEEKQAFRALSSAEDGASSGTYWTQKFIIIPQRVPYFFDSVKDKIFLTGKYLNVIESCKEQLRTLDYFDRERVQEKEDKGGSSKHILPNRKMPYVPFYFSFEEKVHLVIVEKAYLWASRRLMDCFVGPFDLYGRLNFMRSFFLLAKSDFLSNFLGNAEAELDKHNASVSHLESLLDLSIRTSSCDNETYREDISVVLHDVGNISDASKRLYASISFREGLTGDSLTIPEKATAGLSSYAYTSSQAPWNTPRHLFEGKQEGISVLPPSTLANSSTMTAASPSFEGSNRTRVLKHRESLLGENGLVVPPVNGGSFLHGASSGEAFKRFTLWYAPRWPLNLFFTSRAILKYQLIFRLLAHFKWVERKLHAVWRDHMLSKELISLQIDETMPPERLRVKYQLLAAISVREKMLYFCRNFVFYATVDVIEPCFRELLKNLESSQNLDEMMRKHSEFLDLILTQCLFSDTKLLGALTKVLSLCHIFARHILKFSVNRYPPSSLIHSSLGDSSRRLFGNRSGDRSSNSVSSLQRRLPHLEAMRNHLECLLQDNAHLSMIKNASRQFDRNFEEFLNRLRMHSQQHMGSHLEFLLSRLDCDCFSTSQLFLSSSASSSGIQGKSRDSASLTVPSDQGDDFSHSPSPQNNGEGEDLSHRALSSWQEKNHKSNVINRPFSFSQATAGDRSYVTSSRNLFRLPPDFSLMNLTETEFMGQNNNIHEDASSIPSDTRTGRTPYLPFSNSSDFSSRIDGQSITGERLKSTADFGEVYDSLLQETTNKLEISSSIDEVAALSFGDTCAMASSDVISDRMSAVEEERQLLRMGARSHGTKGNRRRSPIKTAVHQSSRPGRNTIEEKTRPDLESTYYRATTSNSCSATGTEIVLPQEGYYSNENVTQTTYRGIVGNHSSLSLNDVRKTKYS
ncbi:Spc97 / Spc98 family protein, partial [Cardiosporidium cionae]